ncbi:hypothetical protein [Lunatimonas salinarum]|uniref:hypothetical protein n=1 Tax=Lunatimonas salinarum TaxID=1774590 RepID=UPI001AE08CE1|nr:hypothetical protein [Lunatimonas salinarum]
MGFNISLDNRVDMYPLTEDSGFYDVHERDNIVIFGINYLFKLKIRHEHESRYPLRPNLEDWVSYVLHAGICVLNIPKSNINLNIGVGLKDYYQNHADFSNFITLKKVRYMFNGGLRSKSIRIRKFHIYPNLFGQANWIAHSIGLNTFVVLYFGMDSLEGIFFDIKKPYLNQRYVLGPGFREFVKIQEAGSYFEAENLLEKLGESSVKLSEDFESFYINFLKKKIEFICRTTGDLSIFYVEGNEVNESFHHKFRDKLGVFGTVSTITNPSVESAYGLSLIKSFRKSSIAEEVAVSIFPDHSTFVARDDNKSL